MAYTPQSWKSLFSTLRKGMTAGEQLRWCEKSRQTLQRRLIELSSDGAPSAAAEAERIEIEEALRKVWTIEQSARKSPP